MSTASSTTSQKVAVFDFGAQYGQLIARRVRDLHVYSEIVPCDITADEVREMAPAAIILSGGPASVNAEDAPRVDPAIYELGVPILGFCYGHQVTSVTLGGSVYHPEVGEYGPADAARRRRRAVQGHAGRSNRVDEPFRCREGRSRRLFRSRLHRRVPRGRHGVPRAQDLHHAVPPRGQAHPSSATRCSRTSCSTSAALSRTGPWTTWWKP